MSKKKNVYPYTDLLSYSEENKIADWNEMINYLERENFIPFYESRTRNVYFEDIDSMFKNKKVRKALKGFMTQLRVKEINFLDE